jgi:hypothetical protein
VKKYIFLLPLYNDWESLSMLLNKISDQMIYLKQNAEILVINDCSNVKAEKFGKYKNINKIQVLNLKKNLGSQKAISVGLNYLNKIHHKSIITVLDSDGEDDVHKIPIMIENAEKNDDKVIVSTRTTRQENLFFRLAYFMHKVLTLFFTLKWISYGNFSSFNSKQLKKILANNYSWLAISSCIAQNCNIIKIKAGRKKRLIGISKLSIMGLISHSLRVNAVFLYRAIILSTLYIFILLNLNFLTFQYLILFVIQILIFNFLLIITLLKNNQKEFYNFTDLINEIIEL